MSKLDDAIREAVRLDDARIAARAADFMRFRLGMNYEQSLQRVRQADPDIDADTWEALMMDADSLTS